MSDITEFDIVVLEALLAGAKTWYSIEYFLSRRGIIPPVQLWIRLNQLEEMGLVEHYTIDDSDNRYIKITKSGHEIVNSMG